MSPARRRARGATAQRPSPRRAAPWRPAFALPLLRLSLVALGAAMFFMAVPPARAVALHFRDVLVEAAHMGRAVDVRRSRVLVYAEHYNISVDLAAAIERAAVGEGIDPDLAFRIVEKESSFDTLAVSSAGALGLTQLMPSTAEWLEPGITREQIFDRDTNLRIGFRYMRMLLRTYDGDTRLALLAYNRGPTRVDSIRAAGGDPGNGYADRVLNRSGAAPYQGSGLLPAQPVRDGR